MDEFKKAVEDFVALSPEEQGRILRECTEEARRRSEEFERKIRLEPWMWDIRITI